MTRLLAIVLLVFAFTHLGLAQARTFASEPQTISQVVGSIDRKPITSREVQFFDLVSQLVESPKKEPILIGVNHPQFKSKLSAFGLRKAIYLDAKDFGATSPSEQVITRISTLASESSSIKNMKFMKPSVEELKALVKIKLMSDTFLKTKSQVSPQPITDAEAQRFYDDNQALFGKSPFEIAKPKVKVTMAKAQAEERIKSWFEILKEKYNFEEISR